MILQPGHPDPSADRGVDRRPDPRRAGDGRRLAGPAGRRAARRSRRHRRPGRPSGRERRHRGRRGGCGRRSRGRTARIRTPPASPARCRSEDPDADPHRRPAAETRPEPSPSRTAEASPSRAGSRPAGPRGAGGRSQEPSPTSRPAESGAPRTRQDRSRRRAVGPRCRRSATSDGLRRASRPGRGCQPVDDEPARATGRATGAELARHEPESDRVATGRRARAGQAEPRRRRRRTDEHAGRAGRARRRPTSPPTPMIMIESRPDDRLGLDPAQPGHDRPAAGRARDLVDRAGAGRDRHLDPARLPGVPYRPVRQLPAGRARRDLRDPVAGAVRGDAGDPGHQDLQPGQHRRRADRLLGGAAGPQRGRRSPVGPGRR